MNVKRAIIIGSLSAILVGLLAVGIKTKPMQVNAEESYTTYNQQFKNYSNYYQWHTTTGDIETQILTKNEYFPDKYTIIRNYQYLYLWIDDIGSDEPIQVISTSLVQIESQVGIHGNIDFGFTYYTEKSFDQSYLFNVYSYDTDQTYYNINAYDNFHTDDGQSEQNYNAYTTDKFNIELLNASDLCDALSENVELEYYTQDQNINWTFGGQPISSNNAYYYTAIFSNYYYYENADSYLKSADPSYLSGQIEDIPGYYEEIEAEYLSNQGIPYIANSYNTWIPQITFQAFTPLPPTTEVIDIPGLMLEILGMPFTFITTAFDVTIFEGTAYQINFSNLFMGLIAILTIMFIIKLFTSGFGALGNYTGSISDNKWKKEQRNMQRENHKMAKEKHEKEMKK